MRETVKQSGQIGSVGGVHGQTIPERRRQPETGSVEQGEADARRGEAYRTGLTTAFHRGEPDGGTPVGKNAAGQAFFVTRDPVTFAVATDHEAVKSVAIG
ncbi:hypothetical protein [Mesorhizobium kowhaii]|uniref:hypothetical protein n=1 Tax=Mesorhizobium kowhaii TaxID=1300272 RepID=UPI00366B66F1